ncbi:MAG: carbon-nitrogen hydrolase [Opitutaceae bacterium]|nr:carbon-nitrogen hydrolase [Opitutaceae bacterium]
MKVTLALLQHACAADPAANLKKTLALAGQAARKGANIICTQELFRTRYFCQSENHDHFALAEPIPGPSTRAFQKIARRHGVVIIASLFEKRASGLYHNTAAIIDADGALLGVYRKMHIPDDPLFYEKFYFTPGDTGFRAWKTKFGKIGVLVCWDQWYPEAARLTAMQGAEILFYPTAIGWHPSEKARYGANQHSAWETIQRAHAVANGCYVAAINRIGHETTAAAAAGIETTTAVAGVSHETTDAAAGHKTTAAGADHETTAAAGHETAATAGAGIEFWGQSFVAGTSGQILAKASVDKEAILLVPVDLAKVDVTRTHWPFLRDRRIDAYGDLTRRFCD